MAWNKSNFGTGASFNFKFDRQEDEDARGETPEAGGFFFSIRAPLAAQASSLALSSAHLKNWKKKKKKAPVSLSEWIFLTPRVRVAHRSFKSLQRTSKKFSNRKDGKFELVSSLSYSVHKYDAYRNCLAVCEPHMHRPHDNSSSSLCGSVVKQWNAKSEDLTFDSSWGQLLCPMFETRRMNLFLLKLPIFLFFYFESVLTLRPIAMRPITKLTRSNLFTKTISKWVLKDILYSLLGSTAFNYVVFWITLFKCRVISWSRSSC